MAAMSFAEAFKFGSSLGEVAKPFLEMRKQQKLDDEMVASGKLMSDFNSSLMQSAQSQTAKLEDKSQALGHLGKVTSDLSLTEPGSVERDLQIGGLKDKVHPDVFKALKRAPKETFASLKAAAESDPEFSMQSFEQILSNPTAIGEAVTQAQRVAAEQKADPQGFEATGRLRGIEAKQQQLQAVVQQAWQIHAQMPAGEGGDAGRENMERRIKSFSEEYDMLENQRDNIAMDIERAASGARADRSFYQEAEEERTRQAGVESRFQRGEAGKFARAAASRVQSAANTAREIAQNVRTVDTALRKEFIGLPEVKNYKTIIPIVQSAREALKVDTKAADLNLIYAAAKTFDPESVVRESETAMVGGTGTIWEELKGQFNSVARGGGRLTQDTRQKLMDEIESRAAGHEQLYEGSLREYQSGAPKIGSLPKLGAKRKEAQGALSTEETKELGMLKAQEMAEKGRSGR